MKKSIRRVCFILLGCFTIILFALGILIHGKQTNETYPYRYEYNIEKFIDGSYVFEEGGDIAYDFLPKYEDVDNCFEISFGMCCNDSVFAPNWLFQYKNAFMASLKYSEDQIQAYQLQKNAIISTADYKNFETGFRENTYVNILTSQYTEFPQHVAMVFYNDETLELIYLFLYETKYEDVYYANRRILKDFPFSREFFMDESVSVD